MIGVMGKTLERLAYEVADGGALVLGWTQDEAMRLRHRLQVRGEYLAFNHPEGFKAQVGLRVGVPVLRAVEKACDVAVVRLFNLELFVQRHA